MPQYTPKTWTTGEIITAAELNAIEQAAAAAQPAADPVSADKVTDGTTNKAYTATEKTKLAGLSALPTQTSNGGKFLTTDGTVASWGTPAAGGAVSDATTSAKGIVQLAGDLGGTADAPTVAKLRRIFDPITYGATYNGTTDDHAAVQAAIDAANAAGGGVVRVSGDVKNNSTLTLKSGVLLDLGKWSLTGSAGPQIALATTGSPDRCGVVGGTITSSTGDGIALDTTGGTYQLGWPRVTLQNVTLTNCAGRGIYTHGDTIEARLINCVTLRAVGIGIYINTTDTILIGCTAAAGTVGGIYIAGGNTKLTACKAYGNQDGFVVAGAGRHMLSSCEAQDNTRDGFVVSGAWNTLAACLADSNGTRGYNVFGSDNTLAGCAAMYGGGGSGQVTPTGFLLSASRITVSGNSNCATPVSDTAGGNFVTVYGSTGGSRIDGGTGGGGLTVAATVATAGALVAGQHNPVNASTAPLTMTLPTGTSGKLLSVEKADASTNAVTVSGSIRGVGSSAISLVWQNEDLMFASDASGSWWPVAGHKTKASLDAAYGSAANSGVRKSGFSIPRGSLDRWDAARAASATQQRDLVLFGDSTTEGVLSTGGTGTGYVPTLRSLMVAAGVTDGGRGQIDGVFDTTLVSGESFAGFVSRTGWAASATNTPPGPNGMSSNTVGDVLTLQYKAPNNAIRVRCSSNNATGRLTVAVNGTTVGTVDPWAAQNQAGTSGTYGQTAKVITGLIAGGTGQTVTITNTGGASIPDPFQFRAASTATTGGAVAPGGYTYAATFVDATGKETGLSPKANQTVPAGTSTNTVTTALDNTAASAGNVPPGITKARLYRAAGLNQTVAANFQLVLEVTNSGGAQIILTDVGNTPGANPPATSQGPFSDPANGGPKAASIAVDFFDSTKGITLHRAGYSGQKYVTSFNPAGQPLSAANFDTQTQLGLQTGLGGPGYDWTVVPDTSGNQRKPALALCAYGINDMNQATAQTDIIPAVQNGVAAFVRFCRAAGCDGLIVIPHLEYAADATHLTYLAQVRDAILNTADAHGMPWVDFGKALPPLNSANATTYGGVHLTQAGYDAEASYLWTNVLAATAPR